MWNHRGVTGRERGVDGDERDDVRQEPTNERPAAALWMSPDNPGRFFAPTERERIDRAVRLVRDHPIASIDEAGLADELAEVELLITAWGAPRLDRAALDLMPKLRAVVHAAGTIKGFADGEVFERGIVVSTAAEENATPVAEYTLAMIILGLKRTTRFAAQLGNPGPGYRDMDQMPPVGINRPTVGVIGASRIGRKVIQLVSQVLDAQIVLYDPYLTSAEADHLGARTSDLDTLCSASNVITVHAPNNPDTWHMLGPDQFARMADGTILINTARGALVDTAALEREAVAGRIDAFLDVTDPEPIAADSPLRGLPNVLLTPHIAGALGEEVLRLGRHAVDEVERFVDGDPFRDPVHHADLTRIA